MEITETIIEKVLIIIGVSFFSGIIGGFIGVGIFELIDKINEKIKYLKWKLQEKK